MKLLIKKRGKLYKEVVLGDQDEYFIGRGKDSDIILPEHNISRQHIQLKKTEDKSWAFINLSENNPLVFDGEEVVEGVLSDGKSFYLQDYEFLLVADLTPSATHTESGLEKQNLAPKVEEGTTGGFLGEPEVVEPSSTKPTPSESSNELAPTLEESSQAPSASDKTTIMNIGDSGSGNKLTAYLKISTYGDSSAAEDIFKLDEQTEWIIGRDKKADMIIESPNMSRKHFKIEQKKNCYYITDLKSANGTLLNHKKLTPKKSYLIQTGDLINILDIEMTFEVKNLDLVRKLSLIKVPPVPEVAPPPGKNLQKLENESLVSHSIDQPLPSHIPKVIMESSEDVIELSFFQKNKKRMLIYGSVLAVIGFFFFSSQKKSTPSESPLAGPIAIKEGELAGLTPEKQAFVKDTFYSATQFYVQGKFAHCRRELEKVHKYTDNYQDSKKLDITCAQAAENHQRKIDLEEKKKKEEHTNQMIQKITQNCQAKFDSFKFKHELTDCLSKAIDLSVADSRVQSLIEQFEFNELEKQKQKEQMLARKALIRKIKKTHTQAQNLQQSGKIEKSMTIYQKFINKANYKELASDKQQAKRELASIRKSYNDNINRLSKGCATTLQSGQFKDAYYQCQKAVEKIPKSHNQAVKKMMKTALQKLASQMKPLYESAALYESTGNISTAQEKWKEIISRDVKEGLYYQRAKIKLDKY